MKYVCTSTHSGALVMIYLYEHTECCGPPCVNIFVNFKLLILDLVLTNSCLHETSTNRNYQLIN